MPDWSYRTVFRPLLFRVPEPLANRLALGTIGLLGRWPGGGWVIDLLGHMRADPRLRRSWLGFEVTSPIGLGPVVDPEFRASAGLARFGVGFLEIGPVTPDAVPFGRDLRRIAEGDRIVVPRIFPNPGLDALAEDVERTGGPGAPLIIHLAGRALECEKAIARLAPSAAAFAFDPSTIDNPTAVVLAIRTSGRPVALVIAADCDLDAALRDLQITHADGVIVTGSVIGSDGQVIGEPARSATLELVRNLRAARPDLPILAGGGVHEPADALALLDAGADLIRVDSGLIYGGPGLPKRCNDAILARLPTPSEPPQRIVQSSWFWAILLGSAMLGGGLLALIIAATRVVLPYDESFCGITRDQFNSINNHLLAFMAHDRVSLAGTMVAVGVSYIFLGAGAIRRGRHWAWIALLTSALAGFASFFLFLGFGYFDPFHAFVTATLFPLLLQIWSGHLGSPQPILPDLREDRAWRRSQWAQLAFVVHGAGVLGAGFVISGIGASSVSLTKTCSS